MNKNVQWKLILILAVVALSTWSLPASALDSVIEQAKALDMDKVRAEIAAFGGDPGGGEDRRRHVEPAEELVGVGAEADAGPGRDVAAEEDQIGAVVLGDADSIEEGQTVGILGHNGSGKSTFLKCVAGILRPTTGEIVTHGRVAALLELGAGFHPEKTVVIREISHSEFAAASEENQTTLRMPLREQF